MRQSLMDATAHLLATQPIWSIKVSDIAAACGAKPPGFYAYFDSVEEVILTLAEQANAARPDMAGLLDKDWTRQDGFECARKLAEMSVQHWLAYRPVLQVVRMRADEGDPDFLPVRVAGMRPLVRSLRARMEAAQARGALTADFEPRLGAYTVADLIESWGQHWSLTVKSGIPEDRILDTLATLLFEMICSLSLFPDLDAEPPQPR
jgi:AcrR family transcriptional regulator